MFESYLIAIGEEKCSPMHKLPTLLHNLGVDGRKTYDNISVSSQDSDKSDDDENVYQVATNKLEKHFGKKVNAVLERHMFLLKYMEKVKK